MIVQEALPRIKRFLKPTGLKKRTLGLVVRYAGAFCLHWGRMSTVRERVLAGVKPRPKVKLLAKEWTSGQFKAIRLYPNQGEYVAM